MSGFKVIGIATIGSFSQADEFPVMLSEALQRNAKQRPGFQTSLTQNLSPCEKLPIIAIPITFKTFTRIVLFLQIQKFFELRISRDDLLCFRKFMIGQVITPAARYRQID